MIEQLFGSKTRVKLLQLFYGHPNQAFYVREITRKIDEQINSVRRELANLLSIGIISSETNNNRLYYEVDQKYEYYQALSAMFGNTVFSPDDVKKTVTKQTDPIHAIGNVELAILTGQFTRDESSGVDILIVGDINKTQLAKYVEDLERQEGKELRYAVLTTSEFDYRKQINDRFVDLVMKSKKNIIVDKSSVVKASSNKKDKEANKEE